MFASVFSFKRGRTYMKEMTGDELTAILVSLNSRVFQAIGELAKGLPDGDHQTEVYPIGWPQNSKITLGVMIHNHENTSHLVINSGITVKTDEEYEALAKAFLLLFDSSCDAAHKNDSKVEH